jgi:hypothetical protein
MRRLLCGVADGDALARYGDSGGSGGGEVQGAVVRKGMRSVKRSRQEPLDS